MGPFLSQWLGERTCHSVLDGGQCGRLWKGRPFPFKRGARGAALFSFRCVSLRGWNICRHFACLKLDKLGEIVTRKPQNERWEEAEGLTAAAQSMMSSPLESSALVGGGSIFLTFPSRLRQTWDSFICKGLDQKCPWPAGQLTCGQAPCCSPACEQP